MHPSTSCRKLQRMAPSLSDRSGLPVAGMCTSNKHSLPLCTAATSSPTPAAAAAAAMSPIGPTGRFNQLSKMLGSLCKHCLRLPKVCRRLEGVGSWPCTLLTLMFGS